MRKSIFALVVFIAVSSSAFARDYKCEVSYRFSNQKFTKIEKTFKGEADTDLFSADGSRYSVIALESGNGQITISKNLYKDGTLVGSVSSSSETSVGPVYFDENYDGNMGTHIKCFQIP